MRLYVEVNTDTLTIVGVPAELPSSKYNTAGFNNLSDEQLADLTFIGRPGVGFLPFQTTDFSAYTYESQYLEFVKRILIARVKETKNILRAQNIIDGEFNYPINVAFITELLTFKSTSLSETVIDINNGFRTITQDNASSILELIMNQFKDVETRAKGLADTINACTTLPELQAINTFTF